VRRRAKERVFTGLGVSAGIAIGPAHVHDSGAAAVPEYEVPAGAVEAERERFAGAVAHATRQVGKLRAKAAELPANAAEELGYLLDAYQQMLGSSRLVRGVDARIARQHVNAEAAVQAEIAEIAASFAEMQDSYLAARGADIREVGTRLIRSLTKSPYQAFSKLPPDAIIVAEDLSPADTALMDPDTVAGFATVLGGAEGHTAIIARSLGLPAVLGVPELLLKVRTGDLLVVDGGAGKVVVNPTAATLERYRAKQASQEQETKALGRLRKVPAITRDGVQITLQANLEFPRDLKQAIGVGAEGIGLLRSEFLFMNRDDLPKEEEQFDALRELVEGMEGHPVTVRTLDVGGDKLANTLDIKLADSPNPALGLRAIRLSLREPALLETQLSAMLRAAAYGPLRILLPMISSASEVREVRGHLRRVAAKLKRRGVKLPERLPPLGAMIEVPGAALTADALARECDFFAIGTNDLTMYTLAIDRGDEQVAHLYNPLHPSVLRLIQFATEAATRARISVSLCGEMAADPRYTALLLGLGIRELSMAPIALPRVKQRIRTLDMNAAVRRAGQIMDQTDSGRITALLDDFNALA